MTDVATRWPDEAVTGGDGAGRTAVPAPPAPDGRSGALAIGIVLLVLGGLVLAPASGGIRPIGRVGLALLQQGGAAIARTASASPAPGKAAAAPVAAPAAAPSSALTRTGTGAFASLAVTVSQTKDLSDQSVAVTWSWSGADKHSTQPNVADFRADYLQLMQCWGDTTPDPTQCEFGGYAGTSSNGVISYAASRQIFPPGVPASANYARDPAESAITTSNTQYYDGSSAYYVPFHGANGQAVVNREVTSNPLYDINTTNEIPYAATRGDGSGYEAFETLTYQQSVGLGCGAVETAGAMKGRPRPCWLVAVPRGETEVDGTPYTLNGPYQRLTSSPLSATNWANRIVFPLNFIAVGQPCPIGSGTRLAVGGVETGTEAVLRWQPALCAHNGPVYEFTQLPQSVVENDLVGTYSGEGTSLDLLNAPDSLPVPTDRLLAYAPIALSGITVAVMVNQIPTSDAPLALKDKEGERVTSLHLTPRLVAKLITQSYRAAVDPDIDVGYLRKNPSNLGTDPDFLALNPQFAQLNEPNLQVLLPTGVSSTIQSLWQYIESDQDARDFIAGLPDPWGMRINPFYQGLQLPQETFPKSDPYCRHDQQNAAAPALCVFDLHPYAADFHDAARSTSRGDSLARELQASLGGLISGHAAPEPPGLRQVLGISDTPTAARYLLVTASLRNAAGAFVAPTTASLLAGAAQLSPSSVPGVGVINPSAAGAAAYPLTVVTYAVVPPSRLTKAAAVGYADFIRYAVNAGQVPGTAPGTLPDGYVPLPATMRARALVVADQVQARIGPPPTITSTTRTATTTTTTTRASTTGSHPVTSAAPTGGGGTSVAAPTGAATPTSRASGRVTATPPPASSTVAAGPAAGSTPADPASTMRFAFLIALCLGIAGVIVGPLLPRLAERLGLGGAL